MPDLAPSLNTSLLTPLIVALGMTHDEREQRIADATARLDAHRQEKGNAEPLAEADLLEDLAVLRMAQGRYLSAVDLRERALVLTRGTLGLESPRTAERLRLLADAYDDAGRLATAESFARFALERARATLPPDAPELLDFRGTLASVLLALGRAQEAKQQAEEALTLSTAVFGAEHPLTCLHRNRHAVAREMTGEPRHIRRAAYETALRVWTEAYGPHHPFIGDIWARLCLAASEEPQKQQEAWDCLERAREIYIRNHGTEHPRLAEIAFLRFSLHQRAKSFSEAEEAARAAVAMNERCLGADHLHTATARGNLGCVLIDQKRYDEGTALIRQSIRDKAAIAPAHPHIAISYGNLAAAAQQESDTPRKGTCGRRSIIRKRTCPRSIPISGRRSCVSRICMQTMDAIKPRIASCAGRNSS